MTVALGTNIANPISTALSQWLGFDTMGKLANYGKLGVTDPDAVIEALFANSEQGVWYDPSDLSTMFQDRAGTTPVTADGQTVGKILDKSGRGNHAVAPSDAARPQYKTDGTYHWLQGDGVNNCLSTAAINFSADNKISCVSGLEKTSGFGFQALTELGVNGAGGAFSIFAPNNNNGNYDARLDGNYSETESTYTPPVKNVLTALFDFSGAAQADQRKLRLNGSSVSLTHGGMASTVGTFSNNSMFIGARNNSSLYLNGKIYSVIIINRTATTQEITDTETWVNGKTGAY